MVSKAQLIAKRSSEKPIAKVGKRRVSISGPKKARKAVSSSSKKKQSTKFLKIPTVKAVKKYVKKQTKSSIPLQWKGTVILRPKAEESQHKSYWDSSALSGLQNDVIQSDICQVSHAREISVDDTSIPTSYEKTWVALIVKDPHWVYAMWEIAQNSLQPFLSQLEDPQYPSRIVLRVYDVTCIQFEGGNANYYFDLEVGRWANNWYINLWTDHASTCAEIGVRAFDGKFTPLARSNFVQTPRSGYSWRTEQIWMEVKDRETHSPYVIVRIPRHHGHPSRNGSSKMIRRKFYLTAEDIRGYYAQLMPFLKNLLSQRWGRRVRLEGNDLNRDAIYRLVGEEFWETRTAGASEILVRRGKRKTLGASEHLSSHLTLTI